jgi:hypothetical protein
MFAGGQGFSRQRYMETVVNSNQDQINSGIVEQFFSVPIGSRRAQRAAHIG